VVSGDSCAVAAVVVGVVGVVELGGNTVAVVEPVEELRVAAVESVQRLDLQVLELEE